MIPARGNGSGGGAQEGPQVELERLGLDAARAGDVLDVDRVEVQLIGDRAHAVNSEERKCTRSSGPPALSLGREGVELTAGIGVGTTENRLVMGRH